MLQFEEEVDIEEIVLAYDFEDLLVEIGSCLGLWLGLSVVGIYDLMAVGIQKAMMAYGWTAK